MSARCWRRTIAELERTSPAEGVAVPLTALTLRAPDAGPCAVIDLEAIAEVGIAAVVLVPARLQVNAAMRVSVRADTDRVLNRRVERLVARFPRLRASAYLHSHPFAHGTTWPSRGPGCDDQGHMIPLLERNREAGLDASFSFIACRDLNGESWVIRAFALDGRRAIRDLGFVHAVADDAPCVRAALAPGLWRRAATRLALGRWRGALERRGVAFEIDDLFGGWVRTVVALDRRTSLVVLAPADFPRGAAQVHVVDRRRGTSRRVALPGGGGPADWARLVDALREVERVGP